MAVHSDLEEPLVSLRDNSWSCLYFISVNFIVVLLMVLLS